MVVEYVDPNNIKPKIGDGLWVKIRKIEELKFMNPDTKIEYIKKHWYNVKQFKYEECHELFANYGLGGGILTSSQMATYCVSLGGCGEYLVLATQKGFQGQISMMRIVCKEDSWSMYPKLKKGLSSNERLKKEYKDEFDELEELKKELMKGRRGNAVVNEQEILESIRDILEIIESGREYYDDEKQEEIYLMKKKKTKGSGGGSRSGVSPYMRNVFPIYGKHCYHQIGVHNIFPLRGRIYEIDGVIRIPEDEDKNIDEVRKISSRYTEEKEEEKTESVRDIITKMDEGQTENDDASWMNNRM